MRAHAWGADVVPPSGHHPLCALIGIFGHQGGMARLWVIEYGASAWRGLALLFRCDAMRHLEHVARQLRPPPE